MQTLKPHEWIFVIAGGMMIFGVLFLDRFGFFAWLPAKIMYLMGIILLLRT